MSGPTIMSGAGSSGHCAHWSTPSCLLLRRCRDASWGGEHEAGLPLILFILVVIAAWRIIVRRRVGQDRPVSIELRAFALAMMVAWLLTLQFWVASPWGLVFELVPGAKGMRVVARYQLWLVLPFLLLVVAA